MVVLGRDRGDRVMGHRKVELIGKSASQGGWGPEEDLGNLFTTMLGICTLLEERLPADPEIGRYLGLLRSSVERGVSLVRRMRG